MKPDGNVRRGACSRSVALAAILAATCVAGSVSAQPAAGASAAKATLMRSSSLTLEAAVAVAAAAMKECRARGALVAVAVTDRAGQALAVQRDPLAGPHTPDTALRKAWTAVSFRGSTLELERATSANSPSNGIRHLPGVAMIGGGMPIEAAGALVGAIGVSGAPGGDLDEACAKAGIAAIRDDLELGN